MNINELFDESDTSDEDYIPDAKPVEVVSEVDSDGDPEDPLSETEQTGKRGQKRRNKFSKSRKKLKTDLEEPSNSHTNKSEKGVTEEEKKKQDDDVWADFIKDTDFKSKTGVKTKSSETKSVTSNTKSKSEVEIKPANTPQTVKVTQIFEFAGEEVKVEKEVACNSAEARLLSNAESNTQVKSKQGCLRGIGSVLSQLGKKQKISTLEKSKLDWDTYKKEHNLHEEIQNHNKGKDGYLERQDFLQRADVRRFEIEKEIRTVERNKRMTNNNPL